MERLFLILPRKMSGNAEGSWGTKNVLNVVKYVLS